MHHSVAGPAPLILPFTCTPTRTRHHQPTCRQVRPRPEVTSRFLVLSTMIGPAIIGKGGIHTKAVKDRTGARVEVVREWMAARAAAAGRIVVGQPSSGHSHSWRLHVALRAPPAIALYKPL